MSVVRATRNDKPVMSGKAKFLLRSIPEMYVLLREAVHLSGANPSIQLAISAMSLTEG